MGRILTVEQAAEILQLNPQVVREYLRKGKLPGRKIGRHWRVSEDVLSSALGAEPEAGKKLQAISAEERKQRVDSIRGKYAGFGRSLEDFLREKHAEVEEEERRWEERHADKVERRTDGEAA